MIGSTPAKTTQVQRADVIVELLTDYGAMTTTQIADDIDECLALTFSTCRRDWRIRHAGKIESRTRGGVQSVTLWSIGDIHKSDHPSREVQDV